MRFANAASLVQHSRQMFHTVDAFANMFAGLLIPAIANQGKRNFASQTATVEVGAKRSFTRSTTDETIKTTVELRSMSDHHMRQNLRKHLRKPRLHQCCSKRNEPGEAGISMKTSPLKSVCRPRFRPLNLNKDINFASRWKWATSSWIAPHVYMYDSSCTCSRLGSL